MFFRIFEDVCGAWLERHQTLQTEWIEWNCRVSKMSSRWYSGAKCAKINYFFPSFAGFSATSDAVSVGIGTSSLFRNKTGGRNRRSAQTIKRAREIAPANVKSRSDFRALVKWIGTVFCFSRPGFFILDKDRDFTVLDGEL